MQLMPAVAQGLHEQRWPDRPFHADALYQPSYNAALGTAELGRLHTLFTSNGAGTTLPMVIAGYNAGQDAVQRWMDAAGAPSDGAPSSRVPVDIDVWIENIGYTETRRYVKRVLGYLRTYELAWSN